MKNQIIVFMVFAMASQAALADAPVRVRAVKDAPLAAGSQRVQDGVAQNRIAGIFQRYDASRRVVRISDVDYELDALIDSPGRKLGAIRSGQVVLFTQGGVSTSGRNVLTSIEPQ
ncbi:MAG: hypothetical protein LDL16_01465 [Thiobacillus sp.]|nr:hypothetical protein [Thiobacillus sp.]